jgi:hypothetical protein
LPPLVAIVDGDAPRAPSPAAGELGAAPSLTPAPQIIIADDLPYRATHAHARELPEHGHHKKHGRHGRPYHPAPGVVVDVVDAQGGADDGTSPASPERGRSMGADLQRATRNVGYWPFRHCYEEGLRRDQALSGKVTLDLSVTATGAVERASLSSASIKDESVALCVAREASRLTVAPSKGTARVEVALSTGDEPVSEPHPVAHAKEIRDALRASWPAVEKCYAGEIGKHPDAGGRLELRFRVKPDGQVVEVAEGDSRFADIDVTRCVLGVYRAATLPALHGAQHETSFAYALHLEAKR